MAEKRTNYTVFLEKRLKSPQHIAGLLNAVLSDGSKEVFLLTMRDVIKAQGGYSLLSEKTGISREHLYTIFSTKGNPSFDSLQKVLKVYGVQLGIQKAMMAA